MNAHAGAATGTDIATLRPLREVVDEYEAKRACLPEIAATFAATVRAAEVASVVGGTYSGSIWPGRGAPHFDIGTAERSLLSSAWKHVYEGLNIKTIAPLGDRQRFERELQDPPAFTLDNIAATFGDYIKRPRHHILRGLAEVFCGLDPAYRSHDKMKIGVAGLPKRVIVSGFGQWEYHGKERVKDILNALAAYQGKPQVDYEELLLLMKMPTALMNPWPKPGSGGAVMFPARDVWLKRFQNGNGHLFFGPDALLDINRALAEFYGDVLPDTPDEVPQRRPGTDVATDLQYYPTPQRVIDRIVADIYGLDQKTVLEPSCGDGRFLDALAKAGAKVRGIEVHPGRAHQARAKGHAVMTANFLAVAPDASFDLVVMNPPFYGKHYAKHVTHAARFLKPGGGLIAILPVTARDDHGLLGEDWLEANGMISNDYRSRDGWEDLPVGSFAESGTNINTVIFRAWRKK